MGPPSLSSSEASFGDMLSDVAEAKPWKDDPNAVVKIELRGMGGAG